VPVCYNIAMARIVMGNRDGPLALAQARTAVSELAAEWPDVHLVQKTIPVPGGEGEFQPLFSALEKGSVNIVLVGLERLPGSLPEGLTLAAVTKRLEPRSALVSKGARSLADLPKGAVVGVPSERDRTFLGALGQEFRSRILSGIIDRDMGLLASGELDALIVPCSTLISLDRRDRVTELLEPESFVPAVGQGSLALIVRQEDDMSAEIAYTLQHRPSFDRVTAERSFQQSLQRGGLAVGALATVAPDGDLTLLGAVATGDGPVLQGTVNGEAGEAEELGHELAQDVLEQLKSLT
jgi:hydroxymethylbilane synthase